MDATKTTDATRYRRLSAVLRCNFQCFARFFYLINLKNLLSHTQSLYIFLNKIEWLKIERSYRYRYSYMIAEGLGKFSDLANESKDR